MRSKLEDLFWTLYKLAVQALFMGLLLWSCWDAAEEVFHAPAMTYWQTVQIVILLKVTGSCFRKMGQSE